MWWSTLPGRAPSASIRDPRSTWYEADGPRGGASTPCRTWLLYRMFDRRIPVAYRSWALDDIDGFWYPMRHFLGFAWYLPLMLLITPPPGGLGAIPVPVFVMAAFMVVSSMFIAPGWNRQPGQAQARRAKGRRVAGQGGSGQSDVPRERVTARSGLTWATLILGITGAASVVAALLAPKVLLTIVKANSPEMGPGFGWDNVVAPKSGHRVVAVAILLVALGVGALGAMSVRRRLGRLLGEGLDQPCRVLRPVTASGKAGVLFWALVIMALAWPEVSGQIVLGLSVLLGTVALLLLPGALVALLMARGTDAHDLAGRDVLWIATRGRVPRVDPPVRGLRPQSGPVPGSALVQPPGPTDPPLATP